MDSLRCLRARPAAVLGAFCVVALAVEMLARAGGPHTVRTVDDLAQLFAALLAAGACGIRAWRERGRLRVSYAALSLATGAWGAGAVIWAWYELVAGVVTPFPSLADVGYLGFPAAAVAALLTFPRPRSGGRGTVRLLLDGATIATSLLLLSWVTTLGTVRRQGSDATTLAFLVSLAYPVTDVILGTVAVLVVARVGLRRGDPLALMGAGMAAMAVSDSAFVYLTATGAYGDGSPLDAGWVAAFLILAAAGRGCPRPESAADDAAHAVGVPRVLSRSEVVLPYVPLLIATAAAAARAVWWHRWDAIELVIVAVLIALVLLRQVLVILDNQTLVVALRSREGQLRHQAFHDSLTGLANRGLFVDRVEHALELQRRDLRQLTVLFLDLDDFKCVNDTLGHPAGDALLTSAAERLRAALRPGDTIARLGGDEFAILLEDDLVEPQVVGQRLLDVFAVPFTIDGQRLCVRASIGLVQSCADGSRSTAAELLRDADLAMYAAKARGKGCLAVFDSGMRLGHDLSLQAELADAIAAGQIDVHYQLLHDARSPGPAAAAGVEALARWNHPGRGPIGPDVFIPLAERTGLIGALGQLVLAAAIEQAAGWLRDDPDREFIVSVNLSPVQLRAPELVATVEAMLRSSGLPADRLLVEVTETALLDPDGRAAGTLYGLVALGVAVAVDDFGTGYSSLTHLRTLPLSVLKIDRTIVASIATNPRDETLCRALVDLAHQLGLRVVAEGVEDHDQLRVLQGLGCDLVQGFLFDRPRPARLLDLLAAWPYDVVTRRVPVPAVGSGT